MKQDLGSYKAFFHGCLRVDETAAGLVPRRFTPEQYAHWQSQGEVRFARSKTSAGALLRFTSSASELRFQYHVISLSSDKMCFDLYEGGHFSESIAMDTSVGSSQVVFHRIFSGEEGRKKEITIYLPFTAEIALSGFDFGEDASPVPRVYEHRVIWLGDSISQGMHASHSSQSIAARMFRITGYEIINQGVGGAGYKDISLDFTYGDYPADRLVILLGTNDNGAISADRDRYLNRMRISLERACTSFPPGNIRLMTPFWRADLSKPEIGGPFEDILAAIRREAQRLGIPLVEGLYANPRGTDFFSDNRLHPNDVGFAAITEALSDMFD